MKPIILLLILALGSFAHAKSSGSSGRSDFLSNLGQGISKKADERYQSRWTIADWFETQRKTRLQDQWLAGNKSDDIYEFYVGGRTGSRTTTVDGVENILKPRANQAMAGAYATLAGLEGSYFDQAGASATENGLNSYGWDAFFGFRPIGDSLQNSNLTLFYGLQFRDEFGGESVKQQAAKARMTIYLTKALGIEGHYLWAFKERTNQAADVQGSAVEASLFLDFSLLRIFGTWTRESRTRTVVATGVASERKRDSLDVGLKIFF